MQVKRRKFDCNQHGVQRITTEEDVGRKKELTQEEFQFSQFEQELELPIGRERRSKEENLTACVEDWKDKSTLEIMKVQNQPMDHMRDDHKKTDNIEMGKAAAIG